MAERYILATDRVALAVKEGRQTQDRRPVKGKPSKSMLGKYATEPYKYLGAPWQPGDLLYVREAHAWADRWVDGFEREEPNTVAYRANGEIRHVHISGSYSLAQTVDDFRGIRWRPNIHMPKWAARTWVRVSRVWVERVRDISEADAQAEGVEPVEWGEDVGGSPHDGTSYRTSFAEEWESLYPGSWKRNDWVWCCEFEREEQGR